MDSERLTRMQQAIADSGVDGWLFYGFHDVDMLGARILQLPPEPHFSRRWFCLIPASGAPRKLVHRIEAAMLDSVPGESRPYLGWRELQAGVKWVLESRKTVATQYSENSAIPSVSRIDGGVLDLVRGCGATVVSSADLIQLFDAVWSLEQIASHDRAAAGLADVLDATYAHLRKSVAGGRATDEVSVQRFMGEEFARRSLVTSSLPIVGCNANSGNPHYSPAAETSQPIRHGDFVLLDLWAKEDQPESVYADLTWTCFLGTAPPPRHVEVFEVVRRARDRGVDVTREAIRAGKPLSGWEVDDAVRGVISEAGFGDYFIHRTGHSLGTEVHGNGANIDNLETQDRRRLLPRTAFTIEPGIYLPGQFGVRSEINVVVEEKDIRVTGPAPQTAIVTLRREPR